MPDPRLAGADATAEEKLPRRWARPILRSPEKTALPWHCLGHRTPPSSTQRSVPWLGVGHPLTAPHHGCAAPGSVFPCMWSHLPPSLGRRGSKPGHQRKTQVQIYLYSVPDRSHQGRGGFTDPFGLWLSGFRTFHPAPRYLFPSLPPLLPTAPWGQRRRRRWLHRTEQPWPHSLLLTPGHCCLRARS